MNKGQSKIHISLLQDLANDLTSETFLKLKERCKAETYGRLGAGQLERIQTLTQLFEKLQQKKVFYQGNYANLKSLLRECEAEDAVDTVKIAEKELFEAGYSVEGYHQPDHAVPIPTPAPPGKSPAGLCKADNHFSRLRQRKDEKAEKIFISFSFTMKDRVTELKDVIEEYIGKDTCWICTTGVRGGDNLDEKISQAINNAEVVLCMISKAYADSADCEKEFLLSRNLGKHMIPILIEQVRWPLVKSDGQASSMQLGWARDLYVNMYDENKMEEEFSKLIEQIKRQLQMK